MQARRAIRASEFLLELPIGKFILLGENLTKWHWKITIFIRGVDERLNVSINHYLVGVTGT